MLTVLSRDYSTPDDSSYSGLLAQGEPEKKNETPNPKPQTLNPKIVDPRYRLRIKKN